MVGQEVVKDDQPNSPARWVELGVGARKAVSPRARKGCQSGTRQAKGTPAGGGGDADEPKEPGKQRVLGAHHIVVVVRQNLPQELEKRGRQRVPSESAQADVVGSKCFASTTRTAAAPNTQHRCDNRVSIGARMYLRLFPRDGFDHVLAILGEVENRTRFARRVQLTQRGLTTDGNHVVFRLDLRCSVHARSDNGISTQMRVWAHIENALGMRAPINSGRRVSLTVSGLPRSAPAGGGRRGARDHGTQRSRMSGPA